MTNHTYYEVYDNNKCVGIFFSIPEIKDFLGISFNSISKILHGNNYVYEGRYKINKKLLNNT